MTERIFHSAPGVANVGAYPPDQPGASGSYPTAVRTKKSPTANVTAVLRLDLAHSVEVFVP